MKRLKTLSSHTAYGRWLSEVMIEPVGWLARSQFPDIIKSPYAYSPCKAVYEWKGKYVVSFEIAHKRYGIFEVPDDMTIYETDDEATDAHISGVWKKAKGE